MAHVLLGDEESANTASSSRDLAFLLLPAAKVDDDLLKQCANLFSNHYGIWGPNPGKVKPGSRVKMSAERLRSQCLQDSKRCFVVAAIHPATDEVVGHVFYSRFYYAPGQGKLNVALDHLVEILRRGVYRKPDKKTRPIYNRVGHILILEMTEEVDVSMGSLVKKCGNALPPVAIPEEDSHFWNLKTSSNGDVLWITQLVVHKKWRGMGVGRRLCRLAWDGENTFACGIVSAHPFSIRCLERMAGVRCNISMIKLHGLRIAAASGIDFVTRSRLIVNKSTSVLQTEFFVDHAEITELITKLPDWQLGTLQDGEEYFAICFPTLKPNLSQSRLSSGFSHWPRWCLCKSKNT